MEERHAVIDDILDLMREIELLVADLYRRFAATFPDDRALWEGLSRDEEVHAGLAAELKDLLQRSGIPAASGKINLASLGTYRKGLEYQLGRLRRGELSRTSALYIARDLERTLVERAFYLSVKREDPEFRAIQERIDAETKAHLRKLEDHIAAVGGEGS